MKKRITSLVMAIVLCLSLCASAFAAAPADELVETLEVNGVIFEIYVGSEGQRPRTATTGVASWNSTPISFTLSPSNGKQCDVRVWNDATDGTNAKVTFTIGVRNNGKLETVTYSEEIAPGQRTYVQATAPANSDGLDGYVDTLIRPTSGLSVPYTYTASQW